MRAQDGTIVEVSEWFSWEASERAHENAAVMSRWNRFFDLADMACLDTLQETAEPFAACSAVELGPSDQAKGGRDSLTVATVGSLTAPAHALYTLVGCTGYDVSVAWVKE
jgi:hypothetical protein